MTPGGSPPIEKSPLIGLKIPLYHKAPGKKKERGEKKQEDKYIKFRFILDLASNVRNLAPHSIPS